MEQSGAEAPEQAVRAALHPRVPSRAQPAERQVRGEHVHSEPAAPVPPVPSGLPQRHSVRAQVLNALREALISGELAPGEVYSAPVLGARLGVSATPVREAMQRLVCEGAVETVPNRGFRVAECSARDLAELAEIRALLEVPAVLRVVPSVPPECWEGLRRLAEETLATAAGGDYAAYVDADSAFHGALLELTGNRQLVAVAADIQRRARHRPAPLAQAPRVVDLLGEASEHIALLDALQAHDLATAERLMRAHVAL